MTINTATGVFHCDQHQKFISYCRQCAVAKDVYWRRLAAEQEERDICAAKSGDHENSAKAHATLEPLKRGQKFAILEFLVDNPSTSEEAWKAGVVGLKSATARFADLKRDGFIYETSQTRKTDSGNDAVVCAITVSGLLALGRLP
jgi:hypothetical protein